MGSILAVSVLAYHFPRWAARQALPFLAATSVGIYLTVPDTERVVLVMGAIAIAGIVSLQVEAVASPIVLALIAGVMMGTATLDSAGRGAAVVRAAGCFGALLALPVAGWLRQLRARDGNGRVEGGAATEHRPSFVTLALVHCVLVAWCSRGQIRELALAPVLLGTGGALVLGTFVLYAAARPVAPNS